MGHAMQGAPLVGLPRKSRTARAGRICAHPGCGTRLSVYNRSTTCSVHTGRQKLRVRGRVRSGA